MRRWFWYSTDAFQTLSVKIWAHTRTGNCEKQLSLRCTIGQRLLSSRRSKITEERQWLNRQKQRWKNSISMDAQQSPWGEFLTYVDSPTIVATYDSIATKLALTAAIQKRTYIWFYWRQEGELYWKTFLNRESHLLHDKKVGRDIRGDLMSTVQQQKSNLELSTVDSTKKNLRHMGEQDKNDKRCTYPIE